MASWPRDPYSIEPNIVSAVYEHEVLPGVPLISDSLVFKLLFVDEQDATCMSVKAAASASKR